MLSPSVVFQAILLVLGGAWCREMFGRWRSDLAELRRATDGSARWAIGGSWLLTAGVLVLMVTIVRRVLLASGLG